MNKNISCVGIFLFIWIFSIQLFAEISVKSFRRLDADLDALVNYPVNDQNG